MKASPLSKPQNLHFYTPRKSLGFGLLVGFALGAGLRYGAGYSFRASLGSGVVGGGMTSIGLLLISKKQLRDWKPSSSSVEEIVTCMIRADGEGSVALGRLSNRSAFDAQDISRCTELVKKLTEELTPLVESFLSRGGIIRAHENGSPTHLKKGSTFITGCSSGKNRSPTFAAYLIEKGERVLTVIAGEDSLFNPIWKGHEFLPNGSGFSEPYTMPNVEEAAFKEVFSGQTKMAQLGSSTAPLPNGEQGDPNPESFYLDYLRNLEPCHFIAFARSCKNMLIRLLEARSDLNGFEVTMVDWPDTINEGAPKASENKPETYREVYQAFKERCEQEFPIIG